MRALRRRSTRWTIAPLLALLLVAPLLAGCIGSDPRTDGTAPATGSTEANATRPQQGGGTGASGQGSVVAFEGTPFTAVRWANGSFQTHQVVVGEMEGPAGSDVDLDAVDVTDLVPRGVPVRLEVNLTYESDGFAEVDVFLRGSDLYGFEAGGEPGRRWMNATAVRLGDDSVEVVANAERPSAGAETRYSLRIEVGLAPVDRIPEAAPVAVDVPSQARLEVVPTDPDASIAVKAWDPEDTYLGRWVAEDGANLTLPLDAGGEHVLFANASVHLVLRAPDGTPVADPSPPRLLDRDFQPRDAHALPPGGPSETFGFEVSRVPLSVLLFVQSGDRGSRPALAPTELAIEVRSPEGTVDTTGTTCGPGCLAFTATGGLFWVAFSSPGNPNLTAGEYTVTVEYEGSAGMEAQPATLSYVR